ncbi:uncharacterized protein ColSpa_12430 [Colletotrichum spaethianum]|uniref:BTB domain-containing protein n=1 Tax=Colletotrichum spaethianum TaxID=700344 RepID=A0AA37PHD3_9PEZI|nr:uncharacterized protein ColSpa_12430 [Colletotrichum spaethianum]GKT52249.1 hypothetical protein ColSpa_12430 [Colletotrichum spaethianum]
MSSTELDSGNPALDPVEELRGSLANLYENAEYSDLTIASLDTEYRVHKAIVCPRSDYFAAKIRDPKSKAAIEGFLSLPDDDPQAVGMVIRYFYHLDYPAGSHQNGHAQVNGHANDHTNSSHDDEFNGSIKSEDQTHDRDTKSGEHSEPLDDFLPPQPQRLSKKKQKKRGKAHAKQENGTNGSSDPQGEALSSPATQEMPTLNQTQENHSEGGGAVLDVNAPPSLQMENGNPAGSGNKNLVLHANVYALSRKYGISGLRSLAFDKFQTEADNQWDTEEFLHAAEKVYTSCSDGDDDRKMKDVVVGMICSHGELMDKVETQKVMRTLPKDLMYDILLQVRQQGGFTR